jgi:hypothetical protein
MAGNSEAPVLYSCTPVLFYHRSNFKAVNDLFTISSTVTPRNLLHPMVQQVFLAVVKIALSFLSQKRGL